ncbi:MAG: DegT/DnrJ/EryC1/StrS family aminotransferase [Deltaproteobacteria bacterium]|nr:DegT/DnrJ/EryC1/StrS family aminotransferase [Deltaproteobacteria bacterium]
MIQYSSFRVEDLGEAADSIPAKDPELKVAVSRLPVVQGGDAIIPVCEPDLSGNEERYVLECVRTNWISSAGAFITRFEKRFAEFCGTKHAVACTSGTAALQLAFYTLGIGPGDEVVMPTFTMVATPNTARHCGATPVFVDSEPHTWNMDVTKLAAAITPRTKAIVPVHTYGHPVDMDPLLELARSRGILVVEDAAEAHGATYKGRTIGGLGDAACFSFYANKIITTGEGGMITTDDDDLATKARNIRDHAFSKERHFWHRAVGHNFRMTNLQAAVGVAQMERVDSLVQRRIDNAKRYNGHLKDVRGITLPPADANVRNVYWMYSILVGDEFGASRDELRRHLAENAIETRTFFIPMHLQPIYYRPEYRGAFPVAEMLCRRGFYLPSAPTLTADQIDFICDKIREAAA